MKFRSRTNLAGGTAILAAMCFNTDVHAQQAESAHAAGRLEEIIVTARRHVPAVQQVDEEGGAPSM